MNLTQAKYYARVYGDISSPRQDSDRGIVQSMCRDDSYDDSDHFTPVGILYYFLNITILTSSIYTIQKATKFYTTMHPSSIPASNKVIFWAAIIVIAEVNIFCFVTETVKTGHSNTYQTFQLPLMVIVFLTELLSVFCVIKDFKMSASVCCCTRPWVIRAVHTLALCHVLWFIHRVGCCSILAVFFIAIAPAQTLASISFLLTIMLTFFIHHSIVFLELSQNGNKYIYFFILFTTSFFFFTFSLALLFFFFVDLTHHGLTSSALGTIIASLTLPSLLFVASLPIKRYYKNYFRMSEDRVVCVVNSQNSNSNEEAPLIVARR